MPSLLGRFGSPQYASPMLPEQALRASLVRPRPPSAEEAGPSRGLPRRRSDLVPQVLPAASPQQGILPMPQMPQPQMPQPQQARVAW